MSRFFYFVFYNGVSIERGSTVYIVTVVRTWHSGSCVHIRIKNNGHLTTRDTFLVPF